MEVLGAAAAISQILVQLISTVDLAKKLKGASKSLKQYQERLNGLQGLCQYIDNNPALRSEEVQRETQSILHIIDTHKSMSRLLKKGRLHRAIAFIFQERSFGDLFATLEEKKANLILYVLNINCLVSHDLNHFITSLSPTPINHDQSIFPGMSMPTETLPLVEGHELAQPVPPTTISQHTPRKAVYHSNKAGHNVDQHIGHHTIGGIVKSGGGFDVVETKYSMNMKTGDGLQVLGLTYDPLGQEEALDHLPAIGGEWSDNEHEKAVGGSEKTKQVQGTWVVPRTDGTVSRD